MNIFEPLTEQCRIHREEQNEYVQVYQEFPVAIICQECRKKEFQSISKNSYVGQLSARVKEEIIELRYSINLSKNMREIAGLEGKEEQQWFKQKIDEVIQTLDSNLIFLTQAFLVHKCRVVTQWHQIIDTIQQSKIKRGVVLRELQDFQRKQKQKHSDLLKKYGNFDNQQYLNSFYDYT